MHTFNPSYSGGRRKIALESASSFGRRGHANRLLAGSLLEAYGKPGRHGDGRTKVRVTSEAMCPGLLAGLWFLEDFFST